jgi:hypothetical protein
MGAETTDCPIPRFPLPLDSLDVAKRPQVIVPRQTRMGIGYSKRQSCTPLAVFAVCASPFLDMAKAIARRAGIEEFEVCMQKFRATFCTPCALVWH